MAGHSKWANIKHRKGAQDAQRGKLFSKLNREIMVATRLGGPDPDANPRLRLAIDKALAQNMPKDNVERAIRKASGEEGTDNVEEVRYEGYAPGGVAVMVDCMTENRNRTVSEVRHAFSKCGGNLGTDGSVAFLFTRQGVLSYSAEVDEEALTEAAAEAGADDVIVNDDGSLDVVTTPEAYQDVKAMLVEAGFEPEQAEVTMRAANNVSLDLENARLMFKLLEMLEDLDDVQQVYSNADISDAVLDQLA